MNRTSLPTNEIISENRQRTDLGDIDELAISIQRFGLIQPIVINQDKRLIAGGRRLAAHIKLGLPNIDVVFRETLSTDELHEMELEENVRRKEMTWQERVVNIKTIHDLKTKRAALSGDSWTQRATSEMLGIKGVSNVNYALRVAELIVKKDQEINNCENLSEAWRKLMKREEDSFLDELANRTKLSIGIPDSFSSFGSSVIKQEEEEEELEVIEGPSPTEHIIELRERSRGVGYLSLSKDEAKELYSSNTLNPPEKFDEYYKEKIEYCSRKEQDKITIPLSKFLFCCDSIDLMNHPDCREKFDAIITDIPYGIDMAMLNQGNDGHAFQNIETVLAEHTVEGNEDLFRRFFPAAWNCLKDNTYLITWCDMYQWRAMLDLATEAGFKCQRWPFVWLKSYPCMNQSANTNFTKTFEVALVCRKGTPTLCKTNVPSHITAGMDSMKDDMNHPFVKPFAVWEPLINAITLEGQHILEPFVGHGSGLLSMLKMKRHVTACEINVEHFNSLIENTKQFYLQQNPNILFA